LDNINFLSGINPTFGPEINIRKSGATVWPNALLPKKPPKIEKRDSIFPQFFQGFFLKKIDTAVDCLVMPEYQRHIQN